MYYEKKYASLSIYGLVLFLILLLVLLLAGCSKDSPVEPAKSIDGKWFITMNGTQTLNGEMNLITASSTVSGYLVFPVYGQYPLSGHFTTTSIDFNIRSTENNGILRWDFTGGLDMNNNKMSGSMKLYDEKADTLFGSGSWSAER